MNIATILKRMLIILSMLIVGILVSLLFLVEVGPPKQRTFTEPTPECLRRSYVRVSVGGIVWKIPTRNVQTDDTPYKRNYCQADNDPPLISKRLKVDLWTKETKETDFGRIVIGAANFPDAEVYIRSFELENSEHAANAIQNICDEVKLGDLPVSTYQENFVVKTHDQPAYISRHGGGEYYVPEMRSYGFYTGFTGTQHTFFGNPYTISCASRAPELETLIGCSLIGYIGKHRVFVTPNYIEHQHVINNPAYWTSYATEVEKYLKTFIISDLDEANTKICN